MFAPELKTLKDSGSSSSKVKPSFKWPIKQRTALKRWQLKLSHGINNDTEYLREINFIS